MYSLGIWKEPLEMEQRSFTTFLVRTFPGELLEAKATSNSIKLYFDVCDPIPSSPDHEALKFLSTLKSISLILLFPCMVVLD